MQTKKILSITIAIVAILALTTCGTNRKDAGKPLAIEEVDPAEIEDSDMLAEIPELGIHPIFNSGLGETIDKNSGIIIPDPTSQDAITDFDGDGLRNEDELSAGSSPYTADYPRIVTRIAPPITMEIRKGLSNISEDHIEDIYENDVQDTITKSMESIHYTSMNEKTTPYTTIEESKSASGYSWSDEEMDGSMRAGSFEGTYGVYSVGGSMEKEDRHGENHAYAQNISSSTMTQGMAFDDVKYRDNLDRNSVEYTSDALERITMNARKNSDLKELINIEPEAGYVRASLFLKNLSVNMPVKIKNVLCTLSFRTPEGTFMPVKTFRLRNDDWSVYEQEIYGNEEFGPYVVEFENLNTYEIKLALTNGYVPQVHVVAYDMVRVENSNYNPGVNNLKIIEEVAKGRTATIKISAPNFREHLRVCAFDVIKNGETVTEVSPGISLKKALFNTFRNTIGGCSETWEIDMEGEPLTVPDEGLKWKKGTDFNEYQYSAEDGILLNEKGNTWKYFATHVKEYTDEDGISRKIETIKRIGPESLGLFKYNPFNQEDNGSYNQYTRLSIDEIKKMKHWVILQNGRYFEGDINDPIWVGERYEIVLFDAEDFKEHIRSFSFSPIRTRDPFYVSTRWNRETNANEFDRAVFLGKVVANDTIHLEVDLKSTRLLFRNNDPTFGFGFGDENPKTFNSEDDYAADTGTAWYWFNNYTLEPKDVRFKGIPGPFTHRARGGTNKIYVEIQESKNANDYKIELSGPYAEGEEKIIWISREELKKKNGVIVITRKTPDIDFEPVGEITGGPFGGDGIEYNVNVTSFGIIDGAVNNVSEILMEEPSSTNDSASSKAYVSKPSLSDINSFTFHAEGYTDSIDILLPGNLQMADMEYYRVYIRGPLNYGSENINEMFLDLTEGCNQIEIDKQPAGVEIDDPGIYSINVYAVNRELYDETDVYTNGGMEAYTGTKFVSVNYDMYRDYKTLKPALSHQLYHKGVIDLEVNFNDGSGWYRLKLKSDDNKNIMNERIIECRYNSYAEHKEQKFHIFFQAPQGDLNFCKANVFHGGKDYVDVYIRPVAEPEYRETFWRKPPLYYENFEGIRQDIDYFEKSFVNIYLDAFEEDNDVSGKKIVDYWTNNKYTDGSRLNDIINSDGGFLVNSVDELSVTGSTDDAFRIVFNSALFDEYYEKIEEYLNNRIFFAMIGMDGNDFNYTRPPKDPAKYFFVSPRVERVYKIKTTIEERDLLEDGWRAKAPSFKIVGEGSAAEPGTLEIRDIYSKYATEYRLFYKQGTFKSTGVVQNGSAGELLQKDVLDSTWEGDVQLTDLDANGYANYTIEGLEPNMMYVVAVRVTDTIGDGESFFTFKGGDMGARPWGYLTGSVEGLPDENVYKYVPFKPKAGIIEFIRVDDSTQNETKVNTLQVTGGIYRNPENSEYTRDAQCKFKISYRKRGEFLTDPWPDWTELGTFEMPYNDKGRPDVDHVLVPQEKSGDEENCDLPFQEIKLEYWQEYEFKAEAVSLTGEVGVESETTTLLSGSPGHNYLKSTNILFCGYYPLIGWSYYVNPESWYYRIERCIEWDPDTGECLSYSYIYPPSTSNSGEFIHSYWQAFRDGNGNTKAGMIYCLGLVPQFPIPNGTDKVNISWIVDWDTEQPDPEQKKYPTAIDLESNYPNHCNYRYPTFGAARGEYHEYNYWQSFTNSEGNLEKFYWDPDPIDDPNKYIDYDNGLAYYNAEFQIGENTRSLLGLVLALSGSNLTLPVMGQGSQSKKFNKMTHLAGVRSSIKATLNVTLTHICSNGTESIISTEGIVEELENFPPERELDYEKLTDLYWIDASIKRPE